MSAAVPELRASVELLVPFYDCDPAGIVWHGHYAKYLDLARCALLDRIDYGYARMAESGYSWPLIEYRTRHLQPLRFNQRAVVEAVLEEWEVRLRIGYLIRNAASGERLCQGHTTQVAVRLDNGEMQLSAPPVLRQRLGVS